MGIMLMGELKRLLKRLIPALTDVPCTKRPPEIVGPDELHEWSSLLGVAAGSPNSARQRPERIVFQMVDALGDF